MDLLVQKDDWKKEKHMPVIEAPAKTKAGTAFPVQVSIGKELPHPNLTEHHITWIDLYFHPQGEKFPHQVGHYAFSAHGEAVAGANTGPVYAEPQLVVTLKINKPGVLHALASCNIHGLWESQQAIDLD